MPKPKLKSNEWAPVHWDHRDDGYIEEIQKGLIGVWNGVQLATGKKPVRPISITEIPEEYHGSDEVYAIISHGTLSTEEAQEYYDMAMAEIRAEMGDDPEGVEL